VAQLHDRYDDDDDDDEESNERLESRNYFETSGGFRSLEFESVQLVLTRKKGASHNVANVQTSVISCYNKFCFFIWRNGHQWARASSFTSFYITFKDTPQSVGLLWTNDQLVAETFT
jgi:hypothetical protein